MDSKQSKLDDIRKYERLLEKQTGCKAVRPYRADSYINVLNKYGTKKDTTEHYKFQQEPPIPDDLLTAYYEGNGLFAKIIDTPAEEAIKHGFTLDMKDQNIENFYTNALDELDWEETAMTAIKWTRLFGGCIIVMLVNDGRGLDEPLDWKNIKSIDDLRVFDRSIIQEDYGDMISYNPDDPFKTRYSRLGMPEYYNVYSKYGTFRVHDSRCLVFQNGILPENTTNSNYQLWGMPEYIRLNRAIRDAEVAHGSAIKLLDRSIQAVYKMKDLSAELATEQGEERVLKRLQTIDMARGLLNSITIDAEGEDYDFRTFQFSGVSEIVDSACNYLSALTSIPQTILFGRSPAGMNSTGQADLENWYNYLERIQSRMVRKNLRYLLSIIFQAGVACKEIDEVPDIKLTFNPLWSMSEQEQAAMEQQKAATQQVKAQTAALYMEAQVIDPTEVRRKLADSEEFDIENMLDEYDNEEDLFANMPQGNEEMPMGGGMPGMQSEQPEMPQEEMPQESMEETAPTSPEKPENEADYTEGVSVEEHNTDPGTEGDEPTAAPAATKEPKDMSEAEKEKAAKKDGRLDSADFRAPITYQQFRGANEISNPAADKAVQNLPKSTKFDAIGTDNNFSTHKPKHGSVGVLVIKDGLVLSGTRKEGYAPDLVCGPGGHVEGGETFEEAAIRETQEEFGITPKDLIMLGYGPWEPDTGLKAAVYLATDYEGELHNTDGEMGDLKFRSLQELHEMENALFQPFKDAIDILLKVLGTDHFDGWGEILQSKDQKFEITGIDEPKFGFITAHCQEASDSRTDGIMSPSEFKSKLATIAKNGDNAKNYLDKYTKSATIKPDIPSSHREVFQTLSDDDIAFIASEFGVIISEATEDELAELCIVLRDDGGPGSGNHSHKGVKGQRGGSAPKASTFGSSSRNESKKESNKEKDKNQKKRKSEQQSTSVVTKPFDGVSAKNFVKKLDEAKATVPEEDRWRVDSYTEEKMNKEHPDANLHVTDGGSTVAVTKEGDIISVCHKEGDPERGRDLLAEAVANGGTKLDAFGPKLYSFYTRNGFEPVSWTPFARKFSPPGWDENRDNEEPIVFYKFTGKTSSLSYNDFISSTAPCEGDEGYANAGKIRDASMEE